MRNNSIYRISFYPPYYVPLVSVRRCWEGCIKEIHIPAIARCVFVYATDENVLRMQKEYTILNPQAVAALYQDQ